MKNISNILKVAFLVLIINGITGLSVRAQEPPPPPPAHGSGGNVPGGGAPVGSGLFILTLLGAAYGAKKTLGNPKNVKIN